MSQHTVSATPAQVADAELAEANFMYDYAANAPTASREELGIATARLHGGVAVAMRDDPTGGYWNKALGFGITAPVTDRVIGDVLDHFRDSSSANAVIQIAPAVLPDDWDDICERHGLREGNQWVKLLRPPDPPSVAATDLRIGPIGDADAPVWADILLDGFGMPKGALTRLFEGVIIEDPNFQAFGAWDGDGMVAAGTLHVCGGRAAFCGVATKPRARNRGAQSALFAARIDAARAAGARVFSAETWKPQAGEANPSLNNMLRAGFVPVYDRTNYLWEA